MWLLWVPLRILCDGNRITKFSRNGTFDADRGVISNLKNEDL